jgi:cytochrome c oxidase subunit 2
MSGIQSALQPYGPEAERVSQLFAVMAWGGGLIFAAVLASAAVAIFAPARWRKPLSSETLVIGAGIVFPVVTLSVLLAYGLLVLGAGARDPGQGEPLRIAVSGEQWWWRVAYVEDGRTVFETANEIRIPVGRTIEFELTTADVIHSFWIPNLAGKVDMIPGRTNTLRLAADKAGVSRGQCAEYCGGAHALMSFDVVAMSPADYAAWFAQASSLAQAPGSPSARRGAELFIEAGCGACHTVRGTAANGVIGPDLTHVGGRTSLAAASLRNDTEAFRRWITDNQHVKPGNRMPPFEIFSPRELFDLARYLEGLA